MENRDTDSFLVGIDNSDCSRRALEFARQRAKAMNARLILAYVIECSPYSFNTPEENEQRHKRREEEITIANASVLAPAWASLEGSGVAAEGIVRHGYVGKVLNDLAAYVTHLVASPAGGLDVEDRQHSPLSLCSPQETLQ